MSCRQIRNDIDVDVDVDVDGGRSSKLGMREMCHM